MLNKMISNAHVIVTVDPDPLIPIYMHFPALKATLNFILFDILSVSINNLQYYNLKIIILQIL